MIQATNEPAGYARTILPIIFVLDTSRAMHGQPISALNDSMRRVVKAIGNLGVSNYDIFPYIGILQFHTGAHWNRPDGLVPADKYEFESLDADGLRDMGHALIELDRKLSRKGFLASVSKGCKPLIIFMTCGMMTDSVIEPLNNLKTGNRWYQNALKIGFALSEDADIRVLCDIVGSSGAVIQTDDYVCFGQTFEKVIINCFKQIWLDYVTDYFGEEHRIEDIVSEVLTESELINDNKISVYLGDTLDFNKYEYVNAQTENTDSILKTTMPNLGHHGDDWWIIGNENQ